ncbi:hypothetical protein HUJ04_010101, partial [Dendroctonus ponderosae]
PPSISLDNANLQLYPINKNKCHHIDPVRDISFQLFTRQRPDEAEGPPPKRWIYKYSAEARFQRQKNKKAEEKESCFKEEVKETARHNPLMPTPLRIGDDEALENSHFNFSEPTIFFFHAFFESYQLIPATYIRTAYTQRGDHNIILLNAPRLEAGPWYLTAAQNTRVVGEYTANSSII